MSRRNDMLPLFEGGALSAVDQIVSRYERATISTVIHPTDGEMENPTPEKLRHYFEDGRSAMELVVTAMISARKASIASILDLPCGYGRIARHFVKAFPEAELTICDVVMEMLDFCVQNFGGKPVLSDGGFDNLHFPDAFDLVWSGSLLTHLPEEKFKGALRLFSRVLAPSGIAIITTHGRHSSTFGSGRYTEEGRFERVAGMYRTTGFGYIDYSDTPNANTANYGISLSSPSYVIKLIEQDPAVRIIGYIERGWSDHQDVLILQKGTSP